MQKTTSTVEDEYHNRVDDLTELLFELCEISQRIDQDDRMEPQPDVWFDIVDAVENHVGPVGIPIKPREIDDWSSVSVTAPSYQDDHISVTVKWDEHGFRVLTTILPHFAGDDLEFYDGSVDEMTREKINERREHAKTLSPEDYL